MMHAHSLKSGYQEPIESMNRGSPKKVNDYWLTRLLTNLIALCMIGKPWLEKKQILLQKNLDWLLMQSVIPLQILVFLKSLQKVELDSQKKNLN